MGQRLIGDEVVSLKRIAFLTLICILLSDLFLFIIGGEFSKNMR